MNFLFICGCGHSGTSLMLGIFANSPEVLAISNETNALRIGSLQAFKKKIKAASVPASWVVEKTPRHVHFLKNILEDEECHALVMVRNPFDVVASLKKRGVPFTEALERYSLDNNAWLGWVSHKRLTVLRYEDFVTNPAAYLKRLGRQYGIDLQQGNKARLSDQHVYFKSEGAKKIVKTDGRGAENHLALRNYQMRQPIENMNGQHLSHLSATEKELIEDKCHKLIKDFGYGPDGNTAANELFFVV